MKIYVLAKNLIHIQILLYLDVLDEIVKTINEISQSVLKKELYQWKDQLDQLDQLDSSMDFSWVPKSLISSLKAAGFDPNETQSDSRKLSTALLLLTLLFDEARMNCARAIDEGNLMKTIIELLSARVVKFRIRAYP